MTANLVDERRVGRELEVHNPMGNQLNVRLAGEDADSR